MNNLKQYFQESAQTKIEFISCNENKLLEVIDIINQAIKS